MRKIPLFLFVIFIVTACTETPTVPPTLMPAAGVPVEEPVDVATAVPPVDELDEEGADIVLLKVIVPTPMTVGIRPSDAEQKWIPDVGPDSPNDWRPPPYDVPLAIHYDDHYYMIRPIPSGSRNFELEWYPFGNDVQTSAIPSYRVHHGMDFPNETGTPILAASSGIVTHAGALFSPRNGVNYYGNTVVIKHDWQWNGEDVYTLYAHTLELFVEEGDYVEQGQLIAGVGSSGEVSGPHLHFEVRVGVDAYGAARNPALWIAPYEGWGTIAGRFVDREGKMISSAALTLTPLDSDAPERRQQTYYPTVASDPVWRENFVFADVPAGKYELILDANDGVHRYKREIEVRPGQTSFEIISTNFTFFATATPPPTPEPTGTALTPLIFLTATPEG